ncbi:MAG: hypothetical protein GEU73_02205 [Chloroflexi bacterium]|nr:hypothetical protein [Chloroflexota bacterium]
MQPGAQAAGTDVKPVDLTEWAEAINSALDDGTPCILTTASRSGSPDVAFKGSMMVWDSDHLAWWERSRAEQIEQVAANPQVVVFYRNQNRGISYLRLYGEATIHQEGELREQVMGRTHPRELQADPERKGFGVVIRVDRVRLARNTVQQREGA